MSQARVLILTVGYGTKDMLEETLYLPILKSIHAGDWNLVVLLPSRATEPNAFELKRRLPRVPVEIAPLRGADDENDADACFGHFDTIISGLRDRDFRPANMCVDFTRGTKAMSAAVVLAGVRHEIPVLRYIEGERDPARQNNVIPGSERIREVQTAVAAAQKRLDSAYAFFDVGNFTAASKLVAGGSSDPPTGLREMTMFVTMLADLYNAWDRLDYKGACGLVRSLSAAPVSSRFWNTRWFCFVPHEQVRAWIADLATPCPAKTAGRWPKDACISMATHARKLCADLLANGERRIRDKQFEDANLRAYRIAEMVGQIRLFQQGYDSSALEPDDSRVKEFQAYLQKQKEPLRSQGKYLTAARQQAYRFLNLTGS